MVPHQPRVRGLWIYPIKSCRGISVHQLEIKSTGPLFDRQWMIVDENNKFITLRTHSKLALIEVELDLKFLMIKFGSFNFKISLKQESKKVETVNVWKDFVSAGIEAEEINLALSQFLKQKVRLVRYQSDSFRGLKSAISEKDKGVMFADSKPVLLINKNSLDDLNNKLATLHLEPSQLERFRANIIIEGLEAFKEDEATELNINGLLFRNPTLCSRCSIITQDIETGTVVSKETLATLASYRKINGNKVMFGVYWMPQNTGMIRRGDVVELITNKSI